MIASAASDEDGEFEFKKVEPGFYSIGAQATDYVDNNMNIVVKAGEATPLDIPLTPDQGTLIIKIQEIEGDVPQTAEVTIGSMAPETIKEMTEKVLASGTYTVTATAVDKGYLPFSKDVVIEPGETVELLITLVKEEFKIVLPEVYFETAKSEIKKESYETLDQAAETIMKIIGGNPTTKIEVQGHTDSRGDDDYNMQLSNDRAAAVKDYLVSKHNIKADRLVAKGYGESQPTASNATEDGMAKNRRVEFVIMK
jgi:outer membrane protein OmpA-like peptidoglycan-associated protein